MAPTHSLTRSTGFILQQFKETYAPINVDANRCLGISPGIYPRYRLGGPHRAGG